MTEHEFITVLNRRWCRRCDLFQMKRGDHWRPTKLVCDRIYNPDARPQE